MITEGDYTTVRSLLAYVIIVPGTSDLFVYQYHEIYICMVTLQKL